MRTASQTQLPMPVQVLLADEHVLLPGGARAHVLLRQAPAEDATAREWQAIITLACSIPLDPEHILAQAHGFLVDDEQGPIGVVDEIRPATGSREAELVVACGSLGHRWLTLRFDDVEEILPAEQRLIVRPGVPAVVEERRHGATESAR